MQCQDFEYVKYSHLSGALILQDKS